MQITEDNCYLILVGIILLTGIIGGIVAWFADGDINNGLS